MPPLTYPSRRSPSLLQALLAALVQGGQSYLQGRQMRRDMEREAAERELRRQQIERAASEREAERRIAQQRSLAELSARMAEADPENRLYHLRRAQDLVAGRATPPPAPEFLRGAEALAPQPGPAASPFPAGPGTGLGRADGLPIGDEYLPGPPAPGRTPEQIAEEQFRRRARFEARLRRRAAEDAARQEQELERLRQENRLALEQERFRGRKTLAELQQEARAATSEASFVERGLREFLDQGGDPSRQVEYAELLRSIFRAGRGGGAQGAASGPVPERPPDLQPLFPRGTAAGARIEAQQAQAEAARARIPLAEAQAEATRARIPLTEAQTELARARTEATRADIERSRRELEARLQRWRSEADYRAAMAEARRTANAIAAGRLDLARQRFAFEKAAKIAREMAERAGQDGRLPQAVKEQAMTLRNRIIELQSRIGALQRRGDHAAAQSLVPHLQGLLAEQERLLAPYTPARSPQGGAAPGVPSGVSGSSRIGELRERERGGSAGQDPLRALVLERIARFRQLTGREPTEAERNEISRLVRQRASGGR